MPASQDHIDILKSGVKNWNKWREENTAITPNLQGVNLSGADLEGADFRENLEGAILEKTDLCKAQSFFGANLDTNILFEIQAHCPEKLR
jgi:uncharacterized protein YjbI with pentapeptide repeats